MALAQKNILMMALVSGTVALAGCESSDDEQQTANYQVAFGEITEQREGKSIISLDISDLSGTPLTGLTPSIMPKMAMVAGYTHSTPRLGCEEAGGGDYHCTLYYLMPSEMMGNPMGDWSITATVDGESAVWSPTVMMAMNGNGKHQLKGQADMLQNMMGIDEGRPYFIFKESVSGTSDNHDISLFVASKESMMSFPAVTSSTILNQGESSELNINDVSVELSADRSSWVTATEQGGGFYSVTGMTGLTAGVEANLSVRLTVNGELKTTDGMASNEGNCEDPAVTLAQCNYYTTITFTP